MEIPSELAQALVTTGRFLGAQGWVPATSGNLSARLDARHLAITRSGPHKGALVERDLLVYDCARGVALDGRRPSAETALHAALYARLPGAGAILHVHSPAATVLSRHSPGGLILSGWELQKAFAGQHTHQATLTVPVLANDQDMDRLVGALPAALGPAPGLLLAGHGLYAWGASVAEARRHTEAFEFLCHCILLERSLGGPS